MSSKSIQRTRRLYRQYRYCPERGAFLPQGDNDPVDVVEIGSETLVSGGVYQVKPLAVLAMIDDGELDWKVACIKADDPKAASVNDVEDVERCALGVHDPKLYHHVTGCMSGTKRWLPSRHMAPMQPLSMMLMT